jgi:hypothetical protein
LLIFYIALLHVAPFLISDNWEPAGAGLWAKWIYGAVGTKGIWPQVLALGCLLVQALLLINLDIRHKLSHNATLFAGVFLVLSSSVALPLLRLSPVYFANIPLLLAAGALLKTYRRSEVAGELLNAGFYIGIASLFNPAYLLFLFWIFIGLNLLRGLSLRERAMTLAGTVSVYIILGTWYFWNNALDTFWRVQFREGLGFWSFQRGNIYTYIHVGLMLLIVLLVIVWRGQIISRKIMQVQRKIDIFYWGLLIGAIVVACQPSIQEDHLLVIMPFVGLFMGMQVSELKPNVAELLHLLLVAVVLFLQFRPLFLP